MSQETVTRSEYVALMKEVAQNAANISILLNNSEKILSYIENDPTTGRLGLYGVQRNHEERIEAIEDARETEKAKQKVWIAVATFVGGLVMSAGTFLFKIIFGK